MLCSFKINIVGAIVREIKI